MMAQFAKESLQTLKSRIDLVDVIGAHVDLKRQGATFKGLCPFHEEKTPSFIIQQGDTHYHCFGCGAHGDAIEFLLEHVKMSFAEAVEYLANRFHVPLQKVESQEGQVDFTALKYALEKASMFFHCILLHTKEGHQALSYLYERGLDLEFIRLFQIGLAPKDESLFLNTMRACKISDPILQTAGLLRAGKRPFFCDRITFAIRNAGGSVIGFSARKYKEETFGGKYINTAETPLFKKSHVLFGLNYSRKRIAKEKKAIVVEGQVDALRLIQEGFDYTVASLGTAFGQLHVKELLHYGVSTVYLSFDSDAAGQEATLRVGDLFQKEGVEVMVVALPDRMDPDEFLKENGAGAFAELLDRSDDYLTFAVAKLSEQMQADSPAGKTELVQGLAAQIRQWNHSVMVHESLRKLCRLLQIPESTLGVGQEHIPTIAVRTRGIAGMQTVDPDLILEMDFLRYLLASQEGQLPAIVKSWIEPQQLSNRHCQEIYGSYLELQDRDLLNLFIAIEDAETKEVLSSLLQRKVKQERVKEGLLTAVQKILERKWMLEREEIRMKIHSGKYSDEEVLQLAKEFDRLKCNPPTLQWP